MRVYVCFPDLFGDKYMSVHAPLSPCFLSFCRLRLNACEWAPVRGNAWQREKKRASRRTSLRAVLSLGDFHYAPINLMVSNVLPHPPRPLPGTHAHTHTGFSTGVSMSISYFSSVRAPVVRVYIHSCLHSCAHACVFLECFHASAAYFLVFFFTLAFSFQCMCARSLSFLLIFFLLRVSHSPSGSCICMHGCIYIYIYFCV